MSHRKSFLTTLALTCSLTLITPLAFPLSAYSQEDEIEVDEDTTPNAGNRRKMGEDPKAFADRLKKMIERLDKSIDLLREQIVQSQNAPFLPDLYVQLGELLNQKANAIYYLQMERAQRDDQTAVVGIKFGAVVRTQKEAANAFSIVVRDFPKYEQRTKALYLMAVTYKSIDEVPEFMKATGQLQREFPKSLEAMKTRLLMAQHAFDLQQYDEVKSQVDTVIGSPYPVEKNQGRYRLGLVYLIQEKYAEALKLFEQVILDEDLKEQDQSTEISLKSKSARAGLKREALIDSIRAYTHVYKDNPDPITYYSRIAPNEVYYQEVIEKLANRYVTLKKYSLAVQLYRALGERIANPQEVLKIYREVLDKAPAEDRMMIPASEMRYVLDRYNHWISFFNVSKSLRRESYQFFEKQMRELGTTPHDLAKKESDPKKKKILLERAADYYPVYLTYFKGTAYTSRMAMNYADVLYAQEKFIQSGDYYLRTHLGEFGKPIEQEKLLQNAIFCLQKKAEGSFYEQVRARGLLMKSIQSYIAFNPKLKNRVNLNFLYLKARYEQGFYEETIAQLYPFMKQAGKTSFAVSAGEMILDFYNTRNNLDDLKKAAGKILALNLPQPEFNAKVKQIYEQTQIRKVQEKAENLAKMDDFSEGKGYLQAAMNLKDATLRDVALQQALAASKAEKDLDVFIKTATALAQNEKDPSKQAALYQSIAIENLKVGRFYESIRLYAQIVGNSRFPEAERLKALEETLNLTLSLKDFTVLKRTMKYPLFASVSADTKSRISSQITDVVRSSLPIDPDFVTYALSDSNADSVLASLFVNQGRLPPNLRKQVQARVNRSCQSNASQGFCRFPSLEKLEPSLKNFLSTVSKSAPKLESVEGLAAQFGELTQQYQTLDNSGDALFDFLCSIRQQKAFNSFAGFLVKVADANPDLKDVILSKAKESQDAALGLKNRCLSIAKQSDLVRSYSDDCESLPLKPVSQYLSGGRSITVRTKPGDPNDGESVKLRKKIFAQPENSDAFLDLAYAAYENGFLNSAAATALTGISLHSAQASEFRAILGCAVYRLGLQNEGKYHLETASDWKGLKQSCTRL